jgi:hypothetical protein
MSHVELKEQKFTLAIVEGPKIYVPSMHGVYKVFIILIFGVPIQRFFLDGTIHFTHRTLIIDLIIFS